MAQEWLKKYLRCKPEVTQIFNDLEEYLNFCKLHGYVYDESHLYNEKTAWGEMQRVKRGKTPKDNWTAKKYEPRFNQRQFLGETQSMKTVLITGGCGYIGSHVARAFKRADPNNRVVVVDRERREHTLTDVDEFVQCDFADEKGILTLLTVNPGIIVHCAGTSLVGPSMADPAEYYNNNVLKTLVMLNVIKDFPTKPVILFSSSASVYGDPDVVPITEQHELRPISPYGNTKLTIEHILEDYDRAYQIPSVCFRYFNAAGAWIPEADLGQERGATHIIARALEANLAGDSFVINGNDYATKDGTCVRDYIHVQDLADAHLLAVDYILKKPGAYRFNLGADKGISNWEIACYVKYKFGLVDVNIGARRLGDPAELVADSSLARAELGWYPKYSDIETIIESAHDWYCRIGGSFNQEFLKVNKE